MTSPEEKERRLKRLKRNQLAKSLRQDRRYLPKIHKRKEPKLKLDIHSFRNIDIERFEDDEN